VKPPECFLEGPQEVQAPHSERPCDGDGLESLGTRVDLPCKVLTPFARLYDLDHVGGDRWPVKPCQKDFSTMLLDEA
jgi:hypothetical protein